MKKRRPKLVAIVGKPFQVERAKNHTVVILWRDDFVKRVRLDRVVVTPEAQTPNQVLQNVRPLTDVVLKTEIYPLTKDSNLQNILHKLMKQQETHEIKIKAPSTSALANHPDANSNRASLVYHNKVATVRINVGVSNSTRPVMESHHVRTRIKPADETIRWTDTNTQADVRDVCMTASEGRSQREDRDRRLPSNKRPSTQAEEDRSTTDAMVCLLELTKIVGISWDG